MDLKSFSDSRLKNKESSYPIYIHTHTHNYAVNS